MISLSHAPACSAARYGVRFSGAGQSAQQAAIRERAIPADIEAPDDSYRIDIHSDDELSDDEESSKKSKGPSWTKILKVVALAFLAITGAGAAAMSLPKANAHLLRGYNGIAPPDITPVSDPPPMSFFPAANSTALALIPGPMPLPIAHPNALPYPAPALTSHWPNRVELLASSSQNHYSYFSEHGSDYTNSLAESIGRNGTNSLGQSHADMREQGYPIRSSRQYPVSSADVASGWCINAWDKRDTHKQRFALLLDGGREFRRDCRKWKGILQSEYHVPRRNILYYPNSRSDNVAEGIQRIQQRIQDGDLTREDVEVMVYYSGHGRAFYEDLPRPLRDGEAAGVIALEDGGYEEATLRDMLQTHLPDIPTTVILDACQSGAWIS